MSLIEPVASRYRVPFDGSFRVADAEDVGEELLIRVAERLPGSRSAERVVVAARNLMPRPRGLDWAASASFALTFLTKVLKRLVLSKAEGGFTKRLRGGGMMAMLMGLLVTVAVQSSSITTSLVVSMG